MVVIFAVGVRCPGSRIVSAAVDVVVVAAVWRGVILCSISQSSIIMACRYRHSRVLDCFIAICILM